MAVWLLHDEYDYNSDPAYISVTTLQKPIRQIILPRRVPPQQRTADVADYIARTLGNAVHDSIEKSWLKGYGRSMKLLGYPDSAIDKIRINPEKPEPGMINIYLERRGIREFRGYKIGGKFDMVTDGFIQDTKSTSAFAWVNGTKDDDHILQTSMYKWIFPEIITEDVGFINFLFTDWQKAQARSNPKYPQSRLQTKTLTLLGSDKVEAFIGHKLDQIKRYMNASQAEIPECTDAELWRSEPKYKYYADPAKTVKSTKNFDSLAEANAHMAAAGKGIVKIIPGEVKACGYCAAYEICEQRKKYFDD